MGFGDFEIGGDNPTEPQDTLATHDLEPRQTRKLRAVLPKEHDDLGVSRVGLMPIFRAFGNPVANVPLQLLARLYMTFLPNKSNF